MRYWHEANGTKNHSPRNRKKQRMSKTMSQGSRMCGARIFTVICVMESCSEIQQDKQGLNTFWWTNRKKTLVVKIRQEKGMIPQTSWQGINPATQRMWDRTLLLPCFSSHCFLVITTFIKVTRTCLPLHCTLLTGTLKGHKKFKLFRFPN